MSRDNVTQSLEAVEEALAHLAQGLERGGFAAGTSAYRQMAEVVLGQWLWVEQEDARELRPHFRRIAAIATEIGAQLEPYVDVMRRLAALEGLAGEGAQPEPASTAEKVIALLTEADRPLSATEVRAGVKAPGAEVRKALAQLVKGEQVAEVGERRPRYTVAGPAT